MQVLLAVKHPPAFQNQTRADPVLARGTETVAGFPSPCFYVHFGVTRQKRVPTCQVVHRHGDCLLSFWFVTSTWSTFYSILPVPPPSDKRSAVHLLRPLHGNAPDSLLFFVFLQTLEERLQSVMETGLQTRGQTTDRHQSQNMQLLLARFRVL